MFKVVTNCKTRLGQIKAKFEIIESVFQTQLKDEWRVTGIVKQEQVEGL